MIKLGLIRKINFEKLFGPKQEQNQQIYENNHVLKNKLSLSFESINILRTNEAKRYLGQWSFETEDIPPGITSTSFQTGLFPTFGPNTSRGLKSRTKLILNHQHAETSARKSVIWQQINNMRKWGNVTKRPLGASLNSFIYLMLHVRVIVSSVYQIYQPGKVFLDLYEQ